MAFIIMMLARYGLTLPLNLTGTVDGNIFGIMVIYGYFFIILLQILSTVAEDKSPFLDSRHL
jgi:hypothetical protein